MPNNEHLLVSKFWHEDIRARSQSLSYFAEIEFEEFRSAFADDSYIAPVAFRTLSESVIIETKSYLNRPVDHTQLLRMPARRRNFKNKKHRERVFVSLRYTMHRRRQDVRWPCPIVWPIKVLRPYLNEDDDIARTGRPRHFESHRLGRSTSTEM